MPKKVTQPGSKESDPKVHARSPNSAAHTAGPLGLAASFLGLQRTHGNRFAQRLVNGPVIQRLCADMPAAGSSCEEEKSLPGGAGPSAVPGEESGVPPIVHDVLHSTGQPLDANTRKLMEARFGHDFSQVHVHTNSRAAESAEAINAQAYTVGRNVVFGRGQYTPESVVGKELLAHELTHVVQQQGVQVTDPMGVSHPDDRSEREAVSIAQHMSETTHGSSPDQVNTGVAPYVSPVPSRITSQAPGTIARKAPPAGEEVPSYQREKDISPGRVFQVQRDRVRNVITYRIDYLDIASANISSVEIRRELDIIIQEFGLTNEKTSQIDITGFASHSRKGNPQLAHEYGWERAEAVQNYFASKGISWARTHSIGAELAPPESADPRAKAENRGAFIEIRLIGSPMERIGKRQLPLPDLPERPSPKEVLTPPTDAVSAIKKVAKLQFHLAVELGYANRVGAAEMLLNYQSEGFAQAMADLTDWDWQEGEDNPRQVQEFNREVAKYNQKKDWGMERLLDWASRHNIREDPRIPDHAFETGQANAYEAVKEMTLMGYEQFSMVLRKSFPSHDARKMAIREYLQMLREQQQRQLEEKAEKRTE